MSEKTIAQELVDAAVLALDEPVGKLVAAYTSVLHNSGLASSEDSARTIANHLVHSALIKMAKKGVDK